MKKSSNILDLVLIGAFAALMAICAWISIPMEIPFTLQTFGVFIAIGLLGGKRGTIAVLVYILLGLVGLPVFQGFKAGVSTLMGPTGGYIIGFLFSALAMWLMEVIGRKTFLSDKNSGRKLLSAVWLILAMLVGLVICYAFGTVWFVVVYSKVKEAIGFGAALGLCVFPYIIPDLIKIALAFILTDRLKRYIPA